MKPATAGFQRLTQPMAIGVIVVLSEETGIPIVAPLHDVQRQTWEVDSWAAGHTVKCSNYSDHRARPHFFAFTFPFFPKALFALPGDA